MTNWSEEGYSSGFADVPLGDEEPRVRAYAGEQAVMAAEAERGKLSEEERVRVRDAGADAAWEEFTLGWREGRDRRVSHELDRLERQRERGRADALAGRSLADGRRVAGLSGGGRVLGAYESGWRKGRAERLS